MARNQWLWGVCTALWLAAGAGADGGASAQRADTAAAELWRRGLCILSSVVVPAERNSRVPRRLGGAQAVSGRTFSLKVKVSAWAHDEKFLWVATDADVHQIGLADGRLVRSYSKKEGLPDWPVDELLSDGRTLWVLHRRGLATLSIGADTVRDRSAVRFRFARLFRDGAGVWVIADSATWRFGDGGAPPKKLPRLPVGARLGTSIDRGVWLARRQQKTAYFITDPSSLKGRLYVGSYGAVYELADGRWKRIAASGWAPKAGHGALWFLSTRGLGRYDPDSGATKTYPAPDPLPVGRLTHLAVTQDAVWVAVESREQGGRFAGGGLARLEVGSGRWKVWPTINGRRADRPQALTVHESALWAATLDYTSTRTLSAHPGMMHCKRLLPVPTGLCLHRYVVGKRAWETLSLEAPTCEKRLVLGQRGKRQEGVMTPRVVESIALGASRLFAVVRMFPKTFYSGYYTSLDQLAARKDASSPWQVAYAHRPEQLGLQGEQPPVLLISESHGKRVVHGVGQGRVAGLFAHEGRVWAVAEGCVARFDAAADRWQKVLEPGFRFYWKATAALDDGRHLWIGSDRGLVARLDLSTNRCEILAALKDRRIDRIVKNQAGHVVVAGRPADRGCLPVQLEGKVAPLDSSVATFDGTAWMPAGSAPAAPRPRWSVSGKGNFLRGRDSAYYVLGVFQPRFLCASPDGKRLWLATYSGLVRLDR